MMVAVVLAAGQSRRFGWRNKLLADCDGMPLLARVLRQIQAASLRQVVLVTGHAHSRIAALARQTLSPGIRLRIIRSTRHAEGLSGSLRAGVAALPSDCGAALIVMGDMPDLAPSMVRRLRRQWRPGIEYVRPVHRDIPGHPVLLSRALFSAIGGIEGDSGARPVLGTVPAQRRYLLDGGPGCITDIDTPAALRIWNNRRSSRSTARRSA